MRFTSFRIKNYRSIVDTGWNQLASDNITALIGQNESGKTSILEALYSFYNGEIDDDVLRSDLSMPEVSCSFSVGMKKIAEIFSEKSIPSELSKLIGKKDAITLTRSWNEDKTSYVTFGDDEIIEFFAEKSRQLKALQDRTIEDCHKILDSLEKARSDMEKAEREKNTAIKESAKLEKKLARARKNFKRSSKQEHKSMLELAESEFERVSDKVDKKVKSYENWLKKYSSLSEKTRIAGNCLEIQKSWKAQSDNLQKLFNELTDIQAYNDSLLAVKNRKPVSDRLDHANRQYLEQKRKFDRLDDEFLYHILVAEAVFRDKEPEEAGDHASKELEEMNKYYSQVELAEIFFRHIPTFELFEDFSSLLPNKIDLEDVLEHNTAVEGYKAARNFLLIAGLDARFFSQQINRILKQKIEKLNGEITLNFQDYWRQNLGQHNKIRINFELEHYDENHPEKKGKPYIEFWIKDQQERLYPKQRSRGVRWFLSFYLELKASAIQNKDKSRVFLIDEPGLSLHARAQEDVLKVFEDIKEEIQIVYSTHSPHLINLDKLYRLLAVQRSDMEDDRSETLIFDAGSLNAASADTLSPIYTLMGSRITDQDFIKKEDNLVIKDIATYYYLSTLLKMTDFSREINLLPATDVTNIPALVNLLLGWKIEFVILLDGDQKSRMVYNDLKTKLFMNDDARAGEKMILVENINNIEDIFSTLDFKKHILHQRIGIPETNSQFIRENDLSRPIMASEFMLHVQKTGLKVSDFDEETRENINRLVHRIKKSMS